MQMAFLEPMEMGVMVARVVAERVEQSAWLQPELPAQDFFR